MDSLDELLADLQTATTHLAEQKRRSEISSASSGSLPSQTYRVPLTNRQNAGSAYRNSSGSGEHSLQGFQRVNSGSHERLSYGSADNQFERSLGSERFSGGSADSEDIIAPPLPPPPSREVLEEIYNNNYEQESIYEPQNVQFNVKLNSTQSSSHVPASLGHNLSELDALLQDLNSAKFLEEINSRSDLPSKTSNKAAGPRMSSSARPPQATVPKPARFSPGVTHGPYSQSPSVKPSMSGASSATKELDELMNSLSQFKVNPSLSASPSHSQQDDPSYALVNRSVPDSTDSTPPTSSKPTSAPKPVPPKPVPPQSVPPKPASELESMLGSLESDMSRHGVSVQTKGLCAACFKPVIGQVITALGRIWHPEHFCCQSCKEELGTRSFFERDSTPFCEVCYQKLFAPLCGKCNSAILDKCVTAMDQTWHVECFVCEHCGLMLNDEGYHEKDGKPFCRTDYYEIFAPKCGGCKLPIVEDFILTLNTHWHIQCFMCSECGGSLAGGSFYDHEGLPYCETHYYAKRGSLCAGCQKPITGRCITAMSKKFHPEHFVCAFCLKQLNKGTFKEQNDKPYCHPCFVKLFG